MAPSMSQTLKAAARKQKEVEAENIAEHKQNEGVSKLAQVANQFKVAADLGAATKAAAVRKSSQKQGAMKISATKKTAEKKTPKTRAIVEPKELDVSVTISVGSNDIAIELLKKMEEFIEKECVSGLCSIERGGALSRLHMQMVCHIVASSVQMVSKRIKTYLGWDKGKDAPVGHHVLTKSLRNTSLHTFIGMLGYCIKDKGKEHFECVHGAPFDYVVANTVLGHTARENDSVIVIDDSQDVAVHVADLLEKDAHGALPNIAEPMFIPVVYGDRDLANSLLL